VMELDLDKLPKDTEALQEIIRHLVESVDALERRNKQLAHRLECLLRSHYGKKSEKIDPGQLLLAFQDLEESTESEPEEKIEETEEEAPAARKRRKRGRKRLPENLPRERIEHDLPPEQRVCSCCGAEKEKIGEEVTEELEYIPASFRVLEHVRFKYACKKCEGEVTTADLPARVIDKGIPGPGLLSHVITSKYADHLPLHRLVGILNRQGVELNKSTLCEWVGRCADLLSPVTQAMRKDLLLSKVINTDDTPVPVLDRERDRTRKGRLWVYIGDEEHPHVIFDYTPGRHSEGPTAFLKGFRGYLQADAYGGYDGLFTRDGPTEVGCWAHARRYFFNAKSTETLPAHTALAYISRLYKVERQGRALPPEERKWLRHAKARPILEEFRHWLQDQSACVLPKSPMAEAIRYVSV